MTSCEKTCTGNHLGAAVVRRPVRNQWDSAISYCRPIDWTLQCHTYTTPLNNRCPQGNNSDVRSLDNLDKFLT